VALSVPTTSEVKDQIVSQLEAELSTTIPLLPKSFSRVLAAALAAAFMLLYKYAGTIFLSLFVAHASFRATIINGKSVVPLIAWGRLIGVGDPEPATRGEFTIEITVTNQTGTLAANSQLVRPSTGVTYITLAPVTLDAATKTVDVRAVSDPDDGGGAGSIGNLLVADELEFANPLANISRVATVTAQVVSGEDGETEAQYRARIVQKFQKRPQGGAYADYQQWGEEAAGIVNVYPYTSDDPGQIDLYVEATEASSGSADGIPTGDPGGAPTGQLAAVKEKVDLDDAGLATRRPANAAVNYYPIARTAYGVTISGFDVPENETSVKADIENGLAEYFLSREPFIVGLSVFPRRDRITRAAISGIVDSIVSAAGGTIIDTTPTVGGVPIPGGADTLSAGEKAKLEDDQPVYE
jgi:uncharacterized phage protein gp47/JayE